MPVQQSCTSPLVLSPLMPYISFIGRETTSCIPQSTTTWLKINWELLFLMVIMSTLLLITNWAATCILSGARIVRHFISLDTMPFMHSTLKSLVESNASSSNHELRWSWDVCLQLTKDKTESRVRSNPVTSRTTYQTLLRISATLYQWTRWTDGKKMLWWNRKV